MKNVSFRNDVLPLKNVLYRLALRITLSHEEAEDIVQDTMLKVWSRRDDWQEIDSIEAFCLTVCRNLALDRLRRAGRGSRAIADDDNNAADTAGSPLDRAVLTDRMENVRRIMDGLPEKQKSCMQLRDMEGKSYKEIADVLDITEEQVKVNIFRARQTVKKKFKETDKYGL